MKKYLQNQNRIIEVVDSYKNIYPEDYKAVCKMMEEKRKDLRNKYAEVKGSKLLKRALFEIPETLDNFLSIKLTADERDWFKTKEGSIWFAKQFKEFASAKVYD